MKHLGSIALLVGAALLASPEMSETQRAARGVRAVSRAIPNQYIVVLNDETNADDTVGEVERLHGGRRLHVFGRAINGFAIRMSAAAAERLARDPRVKYVQEDGVVELAQSAHSWGLDRIDQRLLPLDTFYSPIATGAGIVVHVVDTGIRVTHTEFAGRASIAGDYVDDDDDSSTPDANDDLDMSQPDGNDCNGHGTHVAATIGGATYGVATAVTLRAHRVFKCSGTGTDADLIAAVDAITATTERPAVVNMSLSGEASDAVDDAIRASIASGVTYVIAAGNQNAPAVNYSPARVVEAITVGATNSSDTRASFSNVGSSVDLFAPGVGITSAWKDSNTATAVLNGTSMATPHVAGVAAMLLELHPLLTPADVQETLVAIATPNVVMSAGTGSPTRLLYADFTHPSPPTVSLLRPSAAEQVLNNIPFTIQWTASDPDGLQRLDVLLSTNGGTTFQPLSECAALAATATSCVWQSPSPATTTARIRVIARDLTGDDALDQSKTNFSIVVKPNLVVSQIANPPSVLAPGNSFSLSSTVKNLGNADAGSSMAKHYLSVDGVKSADDIQLTGARSVPGLVANAESPGTLTVTIPSTTNAGVYTLFACADANSAVDEAAEGDNCTSAGAPLNVDLPDLVETALSGIPASSAPGLTFTVTGTVNNQGPVTAGSSTTRFYLSLDMVASQNDVLMTGTRTVGALSTNASYTATTTVNVPTTVATATYYVLACADDTGKINESDESNCFTGASLYIDKPNLEVLQATGLPAAATRGGTFTIHSTVKNSGPVTAGASTLRFYLSTDAVKSSGDILMTGTRNIAALAAAATSSGNTTVTVPNSTPFGNSYLLSCADDQLKVIESNENNCLASSTTILIARPDLAQLSVSNPPATSRPGESFTLTDSVTNPSAVSAPASTTRYHLSLDTTKDANDVLMTGTRSVPLLTAGATSTGNRTVTVPASAALGSYYAIACADDKATVAESNETNNCQVSATRVIVTRPDLVTTSLSTPPPYISPGGTFSVTDTVVNEGAHTSPSSTTRYYLSLDAVRDASDIALSATRPVGSLIVGAGSTGSTTLTVPASAPLARYYVLSCADGANQFLELDDDNNCGASTDFVVGPPNMRPVAHAGSDSDIAIGVVTELDGSGSSDGDLDALTYQWTMVAVPRGSAAALSGATTVSPTFTADIAGQYVVQLVVYDGREYSNPDVAIYTTGGATRFVAIGDTGTGDSGQYAGGVLLDNTCERSGCDFVVMLGDNIYSSGVDSVTDEQFNTKFELPYADVDVPFYVVLGNHDYGNGGVGDEFYKGQFEVDYTAYSTKWRMPSAFYHFTSGVVEFFGLDTNMQMYGQDAQQRLDVDAWLTASTAPWKIALGHHPYRSNGGHGNAGSYGGTSGVPVTSGDGVKSFMEQVVCGRADLLLSGHDHNLQWLQPNGTCTGTELIISGAGANPKSLKKPTNLAYNQVYFEAAQLGFVYLVATENQLTAEFIGSSGQTLFVRTMTPTP